MVTDDVVAAAREMLRNKAVRTFDEPIQLASGQMSRHFVDGKAGLAQADDLRLACRALHALVAGAGIDYDAVGGLTLGADHIAVGTALVTGKAWFIVRKEAKQRGTARRIEGHELGPGVRVLVVEDVVSTGGSIFSAIDAVAKTGAQVVAAATLLDRGGGADAVLADRGIPYFSIASHLDIDLPPVAPAAGRS